MQCPAVLQSGPRRGEQCGRDPCDVKRYGAYCRYHYLTAVRKAEERDQSDEASDSTPMEPRNDTRPSVYSEAFVECVVCYQNVHYSEMAAFLPCAHVCVCIECAEQMAIDAHKQNRVNQCPVCRGQVSGTIRLFFASSSGSSNVESLGKATAGTDERTPLLGTTVTKPKRIWSRLRRFFATLCLQK